MRITPRSTRSGVLLSYEPAEPPTVRIESMFRRCLLISLLAVFASQAELPPSAYRKWQMEAPEDLEIEVKKATPVVALKTSTVEVDAVVTKVTRSATRLKVGAKIHITYVHEVHERPIVGPSSIPLLHDGEKAPAFLRHVKAQTYEPAAKGRSFSPLIPQ